MTTELTKAAQQALEALKHGVAQLNEIGIPLEADPLHGAIAALERALTQRPAAQTERAAFEAWKRTMLSGFDAWDAWQARASLPAPQQATPALAAIRLADRIKSEAKHAAYLAEIDNLDARDAALDKLVLLVDALTALATPEPVGEPYTLIAMGFGRYEVGAGTNGGVPCVAFGRNGNGDVGTIVTEEPRQMTVDETIAAITFANVEGLNVLQEKMDEVRALYFADTRPAAAPAASGLQWFTVAEHGMPDLGEEVIGGFWYTDPWLKPEFATRFVWGLCRVIAGDRCDFKGGKRWYTFGPSHNQITHWARLNAPALAAAQAKGAG